MIKGLTDQFQLRRDGKIRAGRKSADGRLENTAHFLLHDAPQLVDALTETPSEIYFTVPSDKLTHFFRDDLRWYTKNELVCRSMHGTKNAAGQDMGSVAAFFKVGQEVQGLRKEPFPGIPRAFTRSCGYQSCQDYIQGNCGEHMFLDIIIPQYSMMSLFTLDSVSINAILNAMSTFQKAAFGYQGKFSGQIYKLYKSKGEIKFQDRSGNQKKAEAFIVNVANVSFSEYESKFKSKIDPVDWDALMYIRSRAAAEPLRIADEPGEERQALEAPQSKLLQHAETTSVDRHKQNGNDPAAAKYFAEIALLTGKENSEDMRTATAKHFADVQLMVTYLKNKIAEAKKGVAKKVTTPPASVVETATVSAAPQVQTSPPPTDAAPEVPLF